MGRIEVFFTSGHKVKLDDRTPIDRGNGTIFDFGSDGKEGDEIDMGDALNRTGALVNWEHVAWVRRVKEETEEDE